METTQENQPQVTQENVEISQNSDIDKMVLGCVKWFNNKRGYGFITYQEGDKSIDIFVHHTGVTPISSQYRTLTTGEYVSFKVKLATEEGERNQAINVTGVNGGPLLCDQYSKKKSQFNYDENSPESEDGENWQVENKGNRKHGGKGGGKGGKGGR